MFRNILLLLVASILVVFFLHELAYVLHAVIYIYNVIIKFLGLLFASDRWGILAKGVLGLLLISIIIVGIPALIYGLFTRREMPGFEMLVWIIWTVVAVCVVWHG